MSLTATRPSVSYTATFSRLGKPNWAQTQVCMKPDLSVFCGSMAFILSSCPFVTLQKVKWLEGLRRWRVCLLQRSCTLRGMWGSTFCDKWTLLHCLYAILSIPSVYHGIISMSRFLKLFLKSWLLQRIFFFFFVRLCSYVFWCCLFYFSLKFKVLSKMHNY